MKGNRARANGSIFAEYVTLMGATVIAFAAIYFMVLMAQLSFSKACQPVHLFPVPGVWA